MKYLISRPDKNEWPLDIGSFVSKLQDRWPNAEIRRYPVEIYWNIGEEGGITCGELGLSPGPVVAVEGELRACAEFALWYRQQIPVEQLIWFYDEGFSDYVVLDQQTTTDQIVGIFED